MIVTVILVNITVIIVIVIDGISKHCHQDLSHYCAITHAGFRAPTIGLSLTQCSQKPHSQSLKHLPSRQVSPNPYPNPNLNPNLNLSPKSGSFLGSCHPLVSVATETLHMHGQQLNCQNTVNETGTEPLHNGEV